MEGHENGHGHHGERKREYLVGSEPTSEIRTPRYLEQVKRGTDFEEVCKQGGEDEERR